MSRYEFFTVSYLKEMFPKLAEFIKLCGYVTKNNSRTGAFMFNSLNIFINLEISGKICYTNINTNYQGGS